MSAFPGVVKSAVAAVVVATIAVLGCCGDGTMAGDGGTRIRVTFSDREIIVAMVDNSASRSLIERLPLILEFQDYAGTEKISYPPDALDTSEVPAGYDPSVGDLTLYAPWGNLAFFYRDHGFAAGLVPLGTIISGLAFLDELDNAASVCLATID